MYCPVDDRADQPTRPGDTDRLRHAKECVVPSRALKPMQPSNASDVIDDVRRTALSHLKQHALLHWHSKADHVAAGLGMIELGREVRKHGSAEQQATFVLV